MIFDALKNRSQYKGINDGVDKVLEKVKDYTSDNFAVGKLQIDGDNIFLKFAEYDTASTENAVFEAHKRYIDVMYMVEGCETIYVKNTDKLEKISKEYNPEKDVFLAEFEEKVSVVRLEQGDFIVLFPGDAHAPGYIADETCKVKKIIGKVLL